MELFRKNDLGCCTFIAIYNPENDSIHWNVECSLDGVVHQGDESDNLIEIIKSVYDDYSELEAMELAMRLYKKAVFELIDEDCLKERIAESQNPDYDDIAKDQRLEKGAA